MAQTVKRLPTMPETRVLSLAWEDLLEKAMATYTNLHLFLPTPPKKGGASFIEMGKTFLKGQSCPSRD